MEKIFKAFKELKSNVKALEDKVDKTLNEEVTEIKRNLKILEDLIKSNSNTVKVVDNAIIVLKKTTQKIKKMKKLVKQKKS